MTTQAIQNPANILAAPQPAPGAAPNSSSATEVPFNQLLQREVAERRSADPSSKPEAQRANASAGPAPSAQAPAQGTKQASNADKKDENAHSSEGEEQPDEASAVSAEMLALVASMTQLASAAVQGDARHAQAPSDMQIDPDAAGNGKRVPADIESLQKRGAAAEKGQPAQAVEQLAAAKSGKVEPAAAERAQQQALLSGAAPATGSTPIAAVSVSAEQLASGLEAASSPASPQALQPMQHALNRLNAATTQAPESLAPPVGTPAWDQAVGQKVVWMVAGAQQSASLTLNPPELGPMQIVLNVSNAQANATFVAPQAEVRQALEAALPRLREMLGDAGIQLGQANINAGTPNQGGQFEQGGRHASSHAAPDQHGEQPIAAVRQQAVRQGLGMVDTFA